MFQLLEFTEAKLATLTNRAEKHGDEDVPAVSLGIEIEGANTLLDSIDPKIRQALYMAVDGQEQLPGVEPSTPVLRCNSFERHTLPTKYEGWTLNVDDGIDDTQPMAFGSCKVDKFSIDAKQGGSIVLRLRIGTSDLDAERSGFLGMHVGQAVWIKLTAPEKQREAIDASSSATDLPKDAGGLFADQHGGDGAAGDGQDGKGPGDDDTDQDHEGGIDGQPMTHEQFQAAAAAEIARIEALRPEINRKRTERGAAKTKAALAKGALN